MAEGQEDQTPPRNPRGAPSGYNPKLHPLVVQLLAEQGRTDEQIAQAIGIVPSTLYEWYKKYPELSEAKAQGALKPDDAVEVSLLERALGYSHPEDRIFLPAGSKEPVIVPTIKHYPPDTTAALRWLFNRRRDRWRETQGDLPPDESNPLKVEFGEIPKSITDPKEQDNLEITE